MENFIRDLDESHRNFALIAFFQLMYDQVVGRLAVKMHQLDVPEDGNVRLLIIRQPEENGVLRIQDTIRVTIIDGKHRHSSIHELRDEPNLEYNLTRVPLSLFLTVRGNGQAFSSMEMSKKSKLLNTASATVLSCTSFFALSRSVVAY